MKIIELLAPLAAEDGTPGLPLWLKVVLMALLLMVIAAGLIVWALLHLLKPTRDSSNR
ncbi:hypothetical protein ACWKSP_38155 [Micromonosporaceae bacterium Da 78-11]